MPPLWVGRTFKFDLPVEFHPLVVERLRGAPARIEDKLGGLPNSLLARRHGDRWSIQEHVGHLLDLDELHAGRLDDFLAGSPALRAADMTNRKTWQAEHNARPIAELLRAFRAERGRLVARLDAWPEARWGLAALHPRLEQPMRVIDMALFVAEHDDHHLASMTELIGKLRGPHA